MLKKRNGLDDKYKKVYQKLHGYISREKNFQNIRFAIQKLKPPAIPYIGLYLTDLTFIEDGNPKYVNGKINFIKCRKFADVIRNMKVYQTTRYALEEVEDLSDILKNINYLEEQEMTEMSMKLYNKKDNNQGLLGLFKKKKVVNE
jgi:hypothetical protein